MHLKILIFGALIVGIVFEISESEKFDKAAVFTIAWVKELKYEKRGNRVTVEYSFKNINYTGIGMAYENKSLIGERIFLRLLPDQPAGKVSLHYSWRDSEVIFVPDSIREAPYNGWKELPIPLTDKRLGSDE